MSGRPHLATLFSIAVILASGVNLAIIYAFTSKPRAVIRETVREARTEGVATTMPQPKVSLDDATRKGDVAAVKQHMYWCRKKGDCDLGRELEIAVSSDRASVAKVLLAAGADVNGKGDESQTPLHSAATKGRAGVAEVLIAAGADVNARDEDGFTPLHSAAAWGHAEMARMLLAAGADANAMDRNHQTPLHLVASRRVPPLSVYAEVAKTLLDAGAKPNLRSSDGATPLQMAKSSASRLSLDGNVKAAGDANDVVRLLRDRGGIE